jgi:oligosaccharide repeat unit polymerase
VEAVGILAAALAGIALSRYYFSDYFAPLGLFCVGWLVPLGVSQLSLSAMQDPLNSHTWLLVLGSTAAYLSGLALATIAYKRPATAFPGPGQIAGRIDPRRLRIAMFALLALSLTGYAYEVRAAGGIPLLAPPESRTIAYRTFAIAFVHYATVSAIPAAVLAVLHLRLFGRRGWKLPLATLAVSFALIFSILARQELLLIVVASIMVLAYTAGKPIGATTLMVGASALLLFFIVIGQSRGGTSEFAAQLSGTYMPSWASGLVWPYLYLALNFTVLQFLTHANLGATVGAHTLQPILSFTLTRRLFPLPNVEEEFGWFNTFTYLWPLYSDFRVVGALLVPVLYGIFSGWFYLRFRNRPTAPRLLVYCLIAFTTLFLFQSNGFTFPPYYLFALQFWIAVRFATVVGKPPPV